MRVYIIKGDVTMDTKLKADIAESAVTTELLKRGFRVLKPVGDRLPYDLAVDRNGKLIRIQVKSAWFYRGAYKVDARMTKTNRRIIIRKYYNKNDFDVAIIYIQDVNIFYIMPQQVFSSYKSEISFIEIARHQRKPESAAIRLEYLAQGIGEKESFTMKEKMINRDMPVGKMKMVNDFLPRPEELVMPEETVKITISLKKSSVEFFKHKARECHTKYQRMIRELVDKYAAQYSQ